VTKPAKNVSPAPERSKASTISVGGETVSLYLTPFSPRVTISSDLKEAPK